MKTIEAIRAGKATVEATKRLMSLTASEQKALRQRLTPESARTMDALIRHAAEARRARMVKGLVAVAFALSMQGCGYLFLGTDQIEIPGVYKVTFSKGVDVHAGTNSIGRVDDRRGIFPAEEYKAPAQVKY